MRDGFKKLSAAAKGHRHEMNNAEYQSASPEPMIDKADGTVRNPGSISKEVPKYVPK